MTFVTLTIKFCKKFDNYVTNPTTKKFLWKSKLLKRIYKKVKGDIQIHIAMQMSLWRFCLDRPTHCWKCHGKKINKDLTRSFSNTLMMSLSH